MQLPHGRQIGPGVLLGDPLPRPEAVEHHAPVKARRVELLVNGAPKVATQVRAGLAGRFINRKVRRFSKRRHDAAEPRTARTVRFEYPFAHRTNSLRRLDRRCPGWAPRDSRCPSTPRA